MKKHTFRGGIHPNDFKEQTAGLPIKVLPPAETMIFPMSQHLGAPCTPTVKKGDYVKMWQRIGEPSGVMSSAIHASVSGEVIEVQPRMTHHGVLTDCVVIKNDFKDEVCEDIATPKDGVPLTETVKNAGIVGMGGAGFPTHIKLSVPRDKHIKTVIVNGAECEPYLTSDHRVMLEKPEEVIRGLEEIVSWLGAEEGIIAVEDNKPDAIALLTDKTKGSKRISVAALKKKYPQGSEKQLVTALLGIEIPSGGLPLDKGVSIFNIDTCTAISRAVKYGIPLVRRIVTVSGPIIKEPANFEVRLGTPVSALIEAAGGITEEIGKLIMGGPMMGIALSTDEVPVVKSTGAVLAFGKKDSFFGKTHNCVRCGRCVEACPIRLVPSHLCSYADVGDWEKCKKLNVMDCVECGSCTYVCPSKRYLVQSIRLAKNQIRNQKAN